MSNKGVRKRKESPWCYAIVQADGSFRAADDESRAMLRGKGFKKLQRVRFKVEAERNYTQWKKAHKLGELIAQNLDAFTGMQPHAALKTLQRMSGVECEQMDLDLPGIGKLTVNQPLSLSYDDMDEIRFQKAYSGFCQFLINRWWHDLTQQQIEDMASLVGMAA